MAALPLKDDYRLANCCKPQPGDSLIGFLKYDSPLISVHKKGCSNLAKIEPDRLIALTWDEITLDKTEQPIPECDDFTPLDKTDFEILRHHKDMGNDYAAVVAKMTGIDRQAVFDRHKKLRDLGLLKRVEPLMMQYRKGIVKGKWIKHRNHTYYELTARGEEIIDYYLRERGEA
jgi:hypothetical protein